ncbi:endonuclease V [Deinococcus maricopensis]|uniref:endonuclease V n=1 Tax=Deinococcus maricopensis TaxID=309887 RepID=UPI002478E44C|nr:endonuclease V [Deinococcus maricopensis]
MVALDVDYRVQGASAAGVVFRHWTDAAPARTCGAWVAQVEPYEPGAFFRRELPCLLAVLAEVQAPLRTVIVDGYVWLGEGEPGLGAHLHRALGGQVPVVGVAKKPFRAAPAVPVVRGGSQQPLFVTAIGTDTQAAAAQVAAMHGPHRLPTLLKLADRACRDAPTP